MRFQSIKKQLRCFCYLIVTSIIVLFNSSSSTAQINQIKRETAIGTQEEEDGVHSVLITRKGDILTLTKTMIPNDSSIYETFGHLVTKLNANHEIIWQKFMAYPNLAGESEGIIETADNGYLIIGTNRTNVHPFESTIHLLKININGDIEWQNLYGGSGPVHGIDVEETKDGNFVVLGGVEHSEGLIANPTEKLQMWAGKISKTGSFISGKLLTSNHLNRGFDLAKTKDGYYIACGWVTDEVPVGPDRATGDGVLIKFTEDGTVIWERYVGGSSELDVLYQVDTDQHGNIFAAGSSSSKTGDFLSNRGTIDGWIVKLSPTGDLLWNKLIGGSDLDHLQAISIAANGDIIAGGFTVSSDLDVKDNYYHHSIWLLKISEATNEIENGYFGFVQDFSKYISDIEIAPSGNIFFVATSNNENPFMSDSKGKRDVWLVQTGLSNILKADAFIDVNANGQWDIGEKAFAGGTMLFTNESQNKTEYKSASNGTFLAYLDTGTFNVSYLPNQPYYTVVPQNKKFSYQEYNNKDSVTFALVPLPGKNDLAINIIPFDFTRPGFEASYAIQFSNVGSTIQSNASVKYVKSPGFTVTSALPANYSITGDTLTWNLLPLKPMDKGEIIIRGRFALPPKILLNDTLTSVAFIYPSSNDQTVENNKAELKEVVRGSFDPNDKIEFHGGVLPASSLGKARLTYLIRFQNTGTDTAFNIVISDTLSLMVDPLTIEMITASHPFSLSVKNGNKAEWKFDRIMLPDSNVNEKKSHGYVLYSIKPRSSLIEGDLITNRASIYFDFNDPILTNTTLTKITDIISLPRPILTGLQQNYCGTGASQTISIINAVDVPNAIITVKIDNIPLAVDLSGRFRITPSNLNSGVHTITVSFTMDTAKTDLISQFTVSMPVTPVVKFTSNVNIVNDGVTPILFSAENLSGGGSLPLYTLSLRRDFSTVIHNESQLHSWVVTSQNLAQGDNWIYARMKTSETCYTSLNTIDSIKVVRLAITSIVDIDYPAITITAFPNPFRSDITIRGLQSSISYVTQIIDGIGNVVRTKNVEGKTSVTYYNLDLPNGKYFIKLYDKRRKKLIGTLPVIRM